MEQNRIITQKDIDEVLFRFKRPKLTNNGFGKGDAIQLNQVQLAYTWVTCDTVYSYVKPKTRYIDVQIQYARTYAEKHYLQNVGNCLFGLNWYVTNGAFITACYIAELDMSKPMPRDFGSYVAIRRNKIGKITVASVTKTWKLLPYGQGVQLLD